MRLIMSKVIGVLPIIYAQCPKLGFLILFSNYKGATNLWQATAVCENTHSAAPIEDR
jgi:hypothetical protein